jgi:hypothetical protein
VLWKLRGPARLASVLSGRRSDRGRPGAGRCYGERQSRYEFIRPSNVAGLIEALRDASARKNIIAVVVDPWSLSLGTFKEFAEKFDAEAFPSSGVIITWNEKDTETVAKLPILKNVIDGHFRGRIVRQEYYKEGVKTPEEVREALIATFNSAQERLVEGGQIAAVGPPDAAAHPVLHVTP